MQIRFVGNIPSASPDVNGGEYVRASLPSHKIIQCDAIVLRKLYCRP